MENEILQLKREIEELKKELERLKQHTHTGLDGSKRPEYIDLPDRGVIYFGKGVSLQGPAAGVKDPLNKRGGLLITGDLYCKVVWAQYDIWCNNIYPNSSNAYDLGSTSKYWKTLYADYIYFNPSYGKVYWGTDTLLEIYAADTYYRKNFKPYSTSLNLNLGDPSHKWNYYYGNTSGCDLPIKNSAVDVFKKLPKVVIKEGHYGRGQYLEEDKMPDEFRYEDKNTGEKPISGWHTLGLCVQAIRELIEKIENLEQRLDNLESKNA